VDLRDGYQVRAPADEDLEEVAAVFAAGDLDDAGEVVLDAEFIRTMWHRSGFERSTDAWVVGDRTGTIVAYAHAMTDEPCIVESLGVVHPDHRGRGLGTELLDRIEGRAAEMGAGRLRHAIDADDLAAAEMLRARGLALVRHFWHMGIDLAGPSDPGAVPDGITIGEIDAGVDLLTVHAVLSEAFAEDWGYHPEPYDAWVEGYTTDPAFDPDLWLLARDGDEPVGATTAGADGSPRSGSCARIGDAGSRRRSSGARSPPMPVAVRSGCCSTSMRRTRPVPPPSTSGWGCA
jgi:mycothiol synthase